MTSVVRADALGAALAAVPRYPLAALPTPLQGVPNLSAALGIEVLVKRDDLTGLAMGGNKARKLELIVADAVAAGADMLITSAAARSNFCRMTAGAARRAGMRAGLLLRGTGSEPLQGNLLLDYVLGAEVRFTAEMDPYSTATRVALDAWVEQERRAGGRPYLVYVHGGSRPGMLATVGYVAGAVELAEQAAAAGRRIGHLYVAVGSGSTAAGLLVGLRALGLATRVVGVCVGALSDVLRPRVAEYTRATSELLGVPCPDPTGLVLEDGQRGPAYGVPTEAAFEAIDLLARSEAIVANPVYTGKALAALVADVRRGVVKPGETAVFLHTGGDPLVYAYADTFAAWLRREGTPAATATA